MLDCLTSGTGSIDSFHDVSDPYDLHRFVAAQNEGDLCTYETALQEMIRGHKENHWIWYVFPQIPWDHPTKSDTSQRYAIKSIAEARAYLRHDLLRSRYIEIMKIVRHHLLADSSPTKPLVLMGSTTDQGKLISSATLFHAVAVSLDDDEVAPLLQDVLDSLSDRAGKDVSCAKTVAWLEQEELDS